MNIYKIISIYSIISLLIFSGCSVTVKLPICYQLSKDNLCKIEGLDAINKVTYNNCIKRNIKITPLSSIVAEFTGTKVNINWLIQNYYILVCDFDPDKHGDYTNEKNCSCLTYSKAWIDIVQGNRIDTITLSRLNYLGICIDENLLDSSLQNLLNSKLKNVK